MAKASSRCHQEISSTDKAVSPSPECSGPNTEIGSCSKNHCEIQFMIAKQQEKLLEF